MDYESMLKQLELTSLSQRCKFLKLQSKISITALYIFVLATLYKIPYSSSQTLNYIRPFARTNYLHSSFVPCICYLFVE